MLHLADREPEAALEADPLLALGLNVADGRLVHTAVAEAVEVNRTAVRG